MDELRKKDLEQFGNRIERTTRKPNQRSLGLQAEKERDFELAILHKAVAWLNRGRALRHGTWPDDEARYLGRLQMWTSKPVLIVVNMAQVHTPHSVAVMLGGLSSTHAVVCDDTGGLH